MLIDLSVACAWISMSLAGAVGLGLLRRFGADSMLAIEVCRESEEISPEELYSLEQPVAAGLIG
ncbi:MAG TPA: hypothetical protein VFW38_04065 [Solirubrobacteraceae bacterium]|nr:hypothetical protein [Solirubrobacteraceae bacterium]